MRSPGLNARGFSMRLQKTAHLLGDTTMLVATENRTERWASSSDGHRKEPLLRAAMPRQGVFHPLEGQPAVLRRMDQRFERGRLHLHVAAANQKPVASGCERLHARVRDGIARRDRLHLKIVAKDDAPESQLFPQQVARNPWRERRGALLVNGRHEHV